MATATASKRVQSFSIEKQYRETKPRHTGYRDVLALYGFGMFADSIGLYKLTPPQQSKLKNLIQFPGMLGQYVGPTLAVLGNFAATNFRELRIVEECAEAEGIYPQRTILEYVDTGEAVAICARKYATIKRQEKLLKLGGDIRVWHQPQSETSKNRFPLAFMVHGADLALCHTITD
jgi:hypothetical protein